jgi:hypothetical protein
MPNLATRVGGIRILNSLKYGLFLLIKRQDILNWCKISDLGLLFVSLGCHP